MELEDTQSNSLKNVFRCLGNVQNDDILWCYNDSYFYIKIKTGPVILVF